MIPPDIKSKINEHLKNIFINWPNSRLIHICDFRPDIDDSTLAHSLNNLKLNSIGKEYPLTYTNYIIASSEITRRIQYTTIHKRELVTRNIKKSTVYLLTSVPF